MSSLYTRKMTFNERSYVAASLLGYPMTIQLIFDGEGILDFKRWRNAVTIASEANPGARLVLKGHLGWSRWVDSGVTPPVHEVDGSHWNGYGPDGASFLQESLPFRQGPTSEVILIHGPTPRVLFRTHHGVMDGRGIMFWAEDIFRILRGEKAIGSISNLTDIELSKSFQDEFRTAFPTENIAPTGLPQGDSQGVVWKRHTLKDNIPMLLARCARLAAEEAWRHAEGPVRFAIPVDMRPRKPGLRSTCNLTLDVYIEVKKETTPEQIANDIALKIKLGCEGKIKKFDELLKHVPLWVVTRAIEKIIQKRHQNGLYGLSGILTNLGRIDLTHFKGGGFSARSFWAIPPATEYFPFFLVMSGYQGGSELILSTPQKLASHGRLDDALERIASQLEKTKG
ncbi:MAG TPA: hypothetical protein PLL36_13115 [Candidatus Hydrogenedentes bacterium]|nr:hypothetical protein [Candidatus Hydrogenedentota bacterium]